MTMRNTTMAALLVSAVWIVPASAGTGAGTYTDDGSRAMHDQRHAGLTAMTGGKQSAVERIREARAVHDMMIVAHLGETQLAGFEGMRVMGADGRELGYVLRVDHGSQLLQVHMPEEGKSVAMPVRLVSLKDDRVMASTVSRQDALAMVNTQNATTRFASL